MPSLTYAELAEALKITPASANKLARRRRWPRVPGNDGKARVSVPEEVLVRRDSPPDSPPPSPLDVPPVSPQDSPPGQSYQSLGSSRFDAEGTTRRRRGTACRG